MLLVHSPSGSKDRALVVKKNLGLTRAHFYLDEKNSTRIIYLPNNMIRNNK